MKSTNSFVRNIASTLLCLAAFASASFAASKPLSSPSGLAVDAKGNLYVANFKGNDILVYSPGYAQMTAKTITQGVSRPSGLAFDPLGNLWVANFDANTVTEYTAGKQNTGATITNGILAPQGIAIDGLDNIWVQNNNANVTIFAPPTVYSTPSSLVRTITLSSLTYGIAVGQGTFSWGSSSNTCFVSASTALLSGTLNGGCYGDDTGIALATDASGQVYMGNLDGSVNIASPLGYEHGPFATLSFPPAGIAVDNAHGRVYFSNFQGNSISVYSTAGALLHVIQ
jgi:DNA-binding beta-propeller fold protein YncE